MHTASHSLVRVGEGENEVQGCRRLDVERAQAPELIARELDVDRIVRVGPQRVVAVAGGA